MCVPASLRVGEARRDLKERIRAPDFAHYLYVVDTEDERHLDGGVATYAQVGAKFGYELLWVLLLITVSLAVVQEMCARLGAATGRGLLDLICERFGIGWALFAVGVIVLANGGVTVTEFVGIGTALELLGVTRYLAVPIVAVALWYLVIAGWYGRVERLFLVLTLVFFAYPAAAVLAHPDWGAVARGSFIPTLHADPDHLMLLVGLIGTTITPYMQLFQQCVRSVSLPTSTPANSASKRAAWRNVVTAPSAACQRVRPRLVC